MAKYMLARYHRIRTEMIELLGGECVKCGSTDQLEFDHIDRSTKRHTIASILNRNRSLVLEEVARCQLLCTEHHKEKTRAESLKTECANGHRMSGDNLSVRKSGRRDCKACRAGSRSSTGRASSF